MAAMKNATKGKLFQEQVQEWFSLNRNEKFNAEVAMPIGFPAKLHNFDLANERATVFVECKNYTWTASGNKKSASQILMCRFASPSLVMNKFFDSQDIQNKTVPQLYYLTN